MCHHCLHLCGPEAGFSVIDFSISSTVKPKMPSILRVEGGQLLVGINITVDCKMTEKSATVRHQLNSSTLSYITQHHLVSPHVLLYKEQRPVSQSSDKIDLIIDCLEYQL